MQRKCRYFGTDGIRADAGAEIFSQEALNKLAVGVQSTLQPKRVIIGGDTRESTQEITSRFSQALAATGVNVDCIGVASTPMIAYLASQSYDLGVVVSASHNPYQDNGIKLINSSGTKLTEEQQFQIEQNFADAAPATAGQVQTIAPHASYLDFIKNKFPLNLSRIKIVVDCANGALSDFAPQLLCSLGATVLPIFITPNGKNINEKCGATDLSALVSEVKDQSADIGVAFDGDGDRAMLVDANGHICDGDVQLFVLSGSIKGGVVGTSMTNEALASHYKNKGVPFVRTDVGDRFVQAELIARGWQLGGETSGHIINTEVLPTGDGLVALLSVLQVMLQQGKTLAELHADYQPFQQIMLNYRTTDKQKFIAENNDLLTQITNDFPAARVLCRPSGTEALVRILIEAADAKLGALIQQQLECGLTRSVTNE